MEWTYWLNCGMNDWMICSCSSINTWMDCGMNYCMNCGISTGVDYSMNCEMDYWLNYWMNCWINPGLEYWWSVKWTTAWSTERNHEALNGRIWTKRVCVQCWGPGNVQNKSECVLLTWSGTSDPPPPPPPYPIPDKNLKKWFGVFSLNSNTNSQEGSFVLSENISIYVCTHVPPPPPPHHTHTVTGISKSD